MMYLDMSEKVFGVVGFCRSRYYYGSYAFSDNWSKRIHNGFVKVVDSLSIISESNGAKWFDHLTEYLPDSDLFLLKTY